MKPHYYEVNRRNTKDSRTPIEYITKKWREAKADVHTNEDAAFLAFFVVMQTLFGIILVGLLVLMLFVVPLVPAILAALFGVGYLVYRKVRPEEDENAA